MNKGISTCVLFSQDPELRTHLESYTAGTMRLRSVGRPDKLESQVRQLNHFLLVIDLRTENGLALCADVCEHRPDVTVVVLGVSRSEPMLEAERIGVYAAEEIPLVRNRFQSLIRRVSQHLRLQIENTSLREQVHKASALAPAPSLPRRAAPSPVPKPMNTFSRSFRHINNLQALMENIVESVASAALVSRVGVFARARGDNGVYRSVSS